MLSRSRLIRKLNLFGIRQRIENALALHRRGEVRPDGLTLTHAVHHLQIEWHARDIHPWDRDCDPVERALLFAEQSLADTDAALSRLFKALPETDVIEFSVLHPKTDERILSGTVKRSAPLPRTRNASPRTRLWWRGVTTMFLFMIASGVFSVDAYSQSPSATTAPAEEAPGTSNDLFIMMGSDFDRPGLLPRANYNIGIGHTFGFLKKDPIGDELTFGYTYENAGAHGFFYTGYGEHTEQLGVMKNFGLPGTKVATGYTWVESGITSYTGYSHVLNRMATGAALGAVVHFNVHNSIWLQETYNKVVTVPWYTTSSVGYTYSW